MVVFAKDAGAEFDACVDVGERCYAESYSTGVVAGDYGYGAGDVAGFGGGGREGGIEVGEEGRGE